MDKHTKILKFLYELKHAYKENEMIYTEGSCYRVFCMLDAVFSRAVPWYSQSDGHWVTEVEGSFYDINGEISVEYIKEKDYQPETNPTVKASAYIPTYGGQSCSYNKYK